MQTRASFGVVSQRAAVSSFASQWLNVGNVGAFYEACDNIAWIDIMARLSIVSTPVCEWADLWGGA